MDARRYFVDRDAAVFLDEQFDAEHAHVIERYGDRTRDRDPLPLPAGQLHAALSHFRCQPIRQPGDEIRQRGVTIARTGQAVLEAQLAAWTVAITELSKEPFFAKVVASQKAWVKRTLPYLQINNMSSGELAAAYRHFFGV